MRGIQAASRVFDGTKLDAVIMRGVNDDELEPLLDFAASAGAEVRFIEYMDVGGATHWSSDTVVPRREMLERLRSRFGAITAVDDRGSTAPADRFALPDGRVFGVISSTTEPFCRDCDRARLTADGVFYTCLYAADGLALRPPLRRGDSAEAIAGRDRTAGGSRARTGARRSGSRSASGRSSSRCPRSARIPISRCTSAAASGRLQEAGPVHHPRPRDRRAPACRCRSRSYRNTGRQPDSNRVPTSNRTTSP